MPRPPAFDVRTAEIDVKTAGTEKSPLLLTEGGPEGAGCGGDPVRIIAPPGKTIHPTSVTPKGVTPCSSGMTATGSHGYFYSLRGAQPQGEGFSQELLRPTSTLGHSLRLGLRRATSL